MSTTSSISPKDSNAILQCDKPIDGTESEEEESYAEDLNIDADEEAAEAVRTQREIDEQDDEEEQTQSEGVAPKVARDPGRPTAQDRTAHEVTHVPYRSWCKHCVRGRAKGRQRRRI